MRRLWLVVSVVGLVVLTASSRASAGFYVYKDSRGSLHFSNAPAAPGFRPYTPPASSRGSALRYRPDPTRRRKFDPLIREAAARYRVDRALVKAVIRAESDFVPYARSPKGALGLMQLMPATARRYNAWRLYDPIENIDAGVRHLRILLDRYEGNVRLALAAYNAGDDAVSRYGGIPPYPETIDYLERVLRYHAQYNREF
jgi:soluble lytic murein transglycosylase-like protein